MRLGRPVPPIVLTTDERQTLEQWARRRTTAQAIALRARLVLRCATGETATAIARELRITKQRWQVARANCRTPPGRAAGRAAPRRDRAPLRMRRWNR